MVKKRLGWILGAGTLVLLALWAVLWVSLLPLVEKSIEYLVTRSLPDQPFSCTVRRVGISGAELEAIVLGDPEKPALRIDSLQLNYSLSGLLSRHIERLALEGLQIQGEWLDGRFVPDGFSRDDGRAKPTAASDFSLPGTIGQLSINRGLLRYEVDGRTEQWPFRLQFGQENHEDRGDVTAPLTGSLTLQPQGQELAITLKAAVVDQVLSFKVGTHDFPLIFLAAFLGQDLSGSLQLAAEGRVVLSPFAVSSLDLRCKIEKFVMRGENNSWRLNGAGAAGTPPFLVLFSVADGKWHFESNGLALHSPVELMVSELKGEGLLADGGTSLAGSLQLARIMLNGQDLGGLLLSAEQQAEGVLFAGSHESKVLQGMNLKIKGEAGRSPVKGLHGSLQLSAPKQKFTAFNLGRLVQAKQELTLAGEIGLQAAGSFSEGRKNGDFQLQLHNTRLELPASEVVVSGLNLSLALPDLFQQRSLPAQPLSFASAKVGNLVFADGKFAFQVESSTSLLLESGVFGWCDGHVSTESLRLSTSSKEYEITLLCDRLSLADLFAQLGVERAEGEGTLNGRIPITVVDGRLRFVDGLLSSPPGEGGKIRMRDVGLLTAGIPEGSAQFAQLDFAGEALKDFSYNSAKLLLKSEDDDLLLQIKLDGQPVHPLPFRYNSQLGSFTRLQVGETGGIIQPIRLDINLRLPFEKIMEYGGGMQKLYKMTQ
ncbi:MAG: YdbH domain-containing protein [Desulfoarculaceae bacterium]|nr:YdbH domain-containing protein [Desulfoarculaceae bacterium]